MPVIYVREQGAVVHRRGERLQITRDGVVLADIPLLHVEQLVLVGNVQLTTPAIAAMLQRGIEVIFLSHNYRFRGRLSGTESGFAALRRAQLQMAQDPNRALAMARWIVQGKLANQRAMLRRWLAQPHAREPEVSQAIQMAIAGLGDMERGAAQADSPDALRGFEGKASALYFGALRRLIKPEWGFHGRAYHPPPDPFNAVLSFGYALLLKDATTAVQVVGLDLFVGFFHAIEYGRPSMALDLMEEFRPVLVDALVVRLIQRGSLTPGDCLFTGRSDRPVELRPEACERLISAYEQRLHTRVYHPWAGETTSYRRCLELQARQMARVILGQQDRYHPMTVR